MKYQTLMLMSQSSSYYSLFLYIPIATRFTRRNLSIRDGQLILPITIMLINKKDYLYSFKYSDNLFLGILHSSEISFNDKPRFKFFLI